MSSFRSRWLLILIAASFLAPGMFVVAAPFVAARDAHCVAFSPDGKTVAVAISGQSNSDFPPRPHPSPRKCAVVQLFDLETKKRLKRLETFGDLTQVAFSPDGRLLAAARLFATDDGIELNEVRIWNVADGSVHGAFDRCHAFCFLPGRDEIVVASRKRCAAFDLPTLVKLRQFPPLANAISVTSSGQKDELYGVVRLNEKFAIRRCDGQSGAVLSESVGLPDPFYQLALAANDSRLGTGHAQGLVVLWDPVSLAPIRRINTGIAGRAFPFFSHDGDLLGVADQSNSDVVFWNLKSGEQISRFTYQQGTLRTYRSKSPDRTIRPEEDPARFAFAPDGSSFLGGPFGGILRTITDGREIARFGE